MKSWRAFPPLICAAASGNALVAHPAGILQGVDHQHTGRVERVDTVVAPGASGSGHRPRHSALGCDGEGAPTAELGRCCRRGSRGALRSGQLIYLSTKGGDPTGQRAVTAASVEEPRRSSRARIGSGRSGQFQAGTRRAGRPRRRSARAHHRRRVQEGLLAEVFRTRESARGLRQQYQAIRRARTRTPRAIFALIQAGMESDELCARVAWRKSDGKLTTSTCLKWTQSGRLWWPSIRIPQMARPELAFMWRRPSQENQGIGSADAVHRKPSAGRWGGEIFCLSTQTFNYFVQKGRLSRGADRRFAARPPGTLRAQRPPLPNLAKKL